MIWNITDDRPIWMQLVEQLTEGIVSGVYAPGSRMPSVRDLAAEAGVNPNTMQRALAELENRGLVQTNRTAGRVVTEEMDMIHQKRRELAETQMRAFLEKMKTLGFSKQEILEIVGEELHKEE